jgi:cobalt/nickel transport system permease protein
MAIVGPFAAAALFRVARAAKVPFGPSIFLAASGADFLTYMTTAAQLAFAFPDPAGGFAASFTKFSAVFAVTQIPMAISEGLLTVVVMNALIRFNPLELKEMNVLTTSEAEA